ncbi:hypothetical protein [Xanthomonas vasicola]|uniref:hypothetical protein n=1 Tax=Xanthomonas vasicola TaxID=56459 RepID=UPI001D0C1D0C|nr:hypothetical protein [Xanthomonas vasicola]
MDPVTAFATIVSLLSNFVSHREGKESKDFDSFMAWLTEHHHAEIRSLLQTNATTTVSIKALLNDSRETILERLATLDKMMATVAAGIASYRDLALVAYPSSELSGQAYAILEQFYDSGATSILEVKCLSGEMELAYMDAPSNGSISYTETRFVGDDLTTLVSLGLLDLERNDKGARIFKFKRAAAALVKQRRGA